MENHVDKPGKALPQGKKRGRDGPPAGGEPVRPFSCLAEMQRLHEQMERDQEDIDRLRAETKALLATLKAA